MFGSGYEKCPEFGVCLIFCKQEDYCSSGAFQVAPASYYYMAIDGWFMVFNATINNISIISLWQVKNNIYIEKCNSMPLDNSTTKRNHKTNELMHSIIYFRI